MSGDERVSEEALPPGTGPRHLAFTHLACTHDGETLSVIGELDAPITVFRHGAATGTVHKALRPLAVAPPTGPP
ncbi:beta-propeller fold lactonase family protein [Streptomyces sp. NPDC090025]|uniref:beta-propeller fold lactonase family protein n=1 Tax=Streptomyces sp. NPDC090025 TaxID=3365922 RepID=UPI0038364C31